MKNEHQIAKESKSSFYYAFSLLPAEKREAMDIIYSYCRLTDDIADGNESVNKKKEKLESWKVEFEKSLSGNSSNNLLSNLAGVIKNFNIPKEPFLDLIEGMEDDLNNKIYYSWEELKEYCYKVASTVGIMSIHVFGFNNPAIVDYAINLGIALQLTNIIRDVGEDIENNRIYLPLNELNEFNYSDEELKNKVYNENFVKLMEHQYNRALLYYEKSNIEFNKPEKKSMFPAEAMKLIYYKNLQKVKSNKFNVFDKKIRIGKAGKLYYSLYTLLKAYI